jgi:thiosulfate reductase cytochrome b subunit
VKLHMVIAAVLVPLAVVVAPASASPALPAGTSNARPGTLNARDVPNPMHPSFAVLDSAGVSVRSSGRAPSVQRTCAECHDVGYINAHNDHWSDSVKADCAQCHFEGGRLPAEAAAYDHDGKLLRERIRISAPRDENCALCHGIIHSGSAPLTIPEDFGSGFGSGSDFGSSLENLGSSLGSTSGSDLGSRSGRDFRPGAARETAEEHEKTYAFTLNTGAVFSGQDLSASFLNLQDKSARDYPWDVHARRLVSCIDCHFASNNPTRAEVKKTRLDFLDHDPRRIPLSTYLRQPDHRLAAASCRSCHDPEAVHEFLPYKQRHLQALACQSCHAPHPMGPTAQSVDRTVVMTSGEPATVYRGLHARPSGSLDAVGLDAAYLTGYSPLLLRGRDFDGATRLTPYNAVETWYWASGRGGPELSPDLVRRAYLEGGSYAPAILAVFDTDHDGAVDGSELVLDSAAKTQAVRERLKSLGVADPEIEARVEVRAIHHGMQSGAQVQRDCAQCHDPASRLSAGLALATFIPSGADPGRPPSMDPSLEARVTSAGGHASISPAASAGIYVFGHTSRRWTDRLGSLLLALVAIGVAIHALLLRAAAGRRSRREAHATPTRRVYLYPAYERIWHWLMVVSTLALMLTGLQVHWFGKWEIMPLPRAVTIHNFFAVVLTANAFLALFYYLATAAIVQFLPPKDNLLGRMEEQARYYARGIFLGHPHPSPKTPERKLNPLQQMTYLVLLNVLFPLQVVSGILIWGASRWAGLANSIGGLAVVAPIHNLGSWLFISFLILHIYLTTTGRTAFSNISAMIDGYDEIEAGRQLASGGTNV